MNFLKNSLDQVKAAFADNGISISEWARVNGFSASLVYQILEGTRPCIRGQSHKIAVALGIKAGQTASVLELTKQLNPHTAKSIEGKRRNDMQ